MEYNIIFIFSTKGFYLKIQGKGDDSGKMQLQPCKQHQYFVVKVVSRLFLTKLIALIRQFEKELT